MASVTLPGLLSTDKKKAFALQLAGGDAQNVQDDPSTTGVNLPTNVFSNVTQAPGVAQGDPKNTAQIKEFAFNPTYAQQDQTYRRKLTDAGYARTAQQQDVNDTYTRTVDDAQRQKTDALQRLLESMSSRGLSQSGINLNEQAKTTDAYQRYLDNLSNERAKALSGIESNYAGTVNDIAAAREAMYLKQVQEEEAARLEEARRQAEAQAAQEEADRQAQLMQELIAAQQTALANIQAPSIPALSSPGIGVSVPGVGGGGSAIPAAPAQQYQNLQGMNVQTILKSNNIPVLQSYINNPNLPVDIRLAAESRLRTLQPSAQTKAAAGNVGSAAANLAKGLFKK